MQAYVVGFKIYDGRSLQTQDGNPCDPFVLVDCCGSRYQTATFEERQSLVPWNETCIWPSVELYTKEFESAFIEFKVYAVNWFTRNYLIGKASLQLSFINKRRHHLYARKWLCLRRDDSPECTGMLNVTVFCLRPGEQAPSATQQDTAADDGGDEAGGGEDMENLAQAVLKTTVEAPPGKAHYVMINIHRVEDLPEMSYGLPSPYVTVEFAGCLVKTGGGQQVKQYTFNETAQIPVITPLYEDTIIVKLWHSNWFSSDELMAQGLMSFSELRNTSLAPRWFNLYGWNPDEIPDVTAIAAKGVEPEPNFFKGRLLISGRVEVLDEGDELQAARSVAARAIVEPNMMQVALLGDVYMVTGAEGRKCTVELSFGSAKQRTAVVAYDTESVTTKMNEGNEEAVEDEDEAAVPVTVEEVNSFTFNEKNGRIDALLVMTPDDPQSQPFVMVSVYTEGFLGVSRRVGYARRSLSEFQQYDAGNPSKPKFIALESMPDNAGNRNPPSVLITIEKNRTEDVVRHSRKTIKPMVYIVRAYCFLARNIKYEGMRSDVEPEHYGLRITCAGVSRNTEMLKGPRPLWFLPLDLKVILCSDSTKETPTIEPITVTLVQGASMFNTDLGKAVCVYTHMRRKDTLGNWEPYTLKPQWVKAFGGTHGNQCIGEVLIAFELMLWKHRDEIKLQPREMWPQPESTFSKKEHFCCLKKATLYFSLHGLRDLLPLPRLDSLGMLGGSVPITKPVVTVEVQRFFQEAQDGDAGDMDGGAVTGTSGKLTFRFRDTLPGGDPRVKAEKFRLWQSTMGAPGNQPGANFEMLQVGKLDIQVPNRMILQPYIIIKVMEEPTSMGELLGYKPTIVGESLQSLAQVLPVCWLEGVTLDKTYIEQKNHIREELKAAKKRALVYTKFQQMTEDELKQEIARVKKMEPALKALGDKPSRSISAPGAEAEAKEFVNASALPRPLRERMGERRPLLLMPNIEPEAPFSPRLGEEVKTIGGEGVRRVLYGKLENSTEFPFQHDFWYKNMPLLRNHDVVNGDGEETDWNFQPGKCFGFVKCTYKLVDGHMEEDEEAEEEEAQQAGMEGTALAQLDEEEHEDSDMDMLKRSFNFNQELNSYAFDEKAMMARFKGAERVPSRVRVRIYLVKAICIFAKGSGFPDPFIEFQLGRNINVSMRNMVQMDTNSPEFYRVEERDIELPEDSRLEVRIMDLAGMAFSDAMIGATVIDLEDRWHSTVWNKSNNLQAVPVENRSLFTPEVTGLNRGNLEMWVEMIESVKASDVKPSDLRRPPDTELEVRLVVWGAINVKLVKGEYVNVKFSTMFDCKEYNGEYPAKQETDIHFGSKDGKAVFNWRMVYPKIRMPTNSCTILVQLYHYELLGDTFIGSLNLDLKKYVERVATYMDALVVGPADLKFAGTEADGDEDVGSVNMSLYVMTQTEANSKKAGIAREEPNEDPQLITPTEGRDWGSFFGAFAWPDFGLWKKFIPVFIALGVFLVLVVIMKQIGML